MIEIVQIPLLHDNYTYLLHRDGAGIVIDPAQGEPVLRVLREKQVNLRAVLCTHHHMDHVGGNLELQAATGCDVVGPAHDLERIPGATRGAVPGETLAVDKLTLRVLDVRAHTRGHVAYALDEAVARVVRHGHGGHPTEIPRLRQKPALFVGDSLFLGGCGRLFEGTPADLWRVMGTLAAESRDALVCCAHEYTKANLRFAQRELPHISDIEARLLGLPAEMADSRSSVPDLLARELETNPFLLCLRANVQAALAERYQMPAASTEVDVIGALRRAKDGG